MNERLHMGLYGAEGDILLTFLHLYYCLPQTSNFFAALDDSGDEAPAPVKKEPKKKAAKPAPVEATKPNER